MIRIYLNKDCFTERERQMIYGSLRRLLPLVLEVNKEIVALNKVCGTGIKFQIEICNSFIMEVKDV